MLARLNTRGHGFTIAIRKRIFDNLDPIAGIHCDMTPQYRRSVRHHLEGDDPAFGSVLWPRQSYFSATGSTRIDDRNTLSSLAHGSKTKVVRGRLPKGRAALEKRHSVTSEGDSRDGRREVDVVAPTDESAARPGVAGAAVISGQSIRLGGTSVAAAFTTRDICEGRVGRPDAFEKWDPHASPKTKGRRPTYLD